MNVIAGDDQRIHNSVDTLQKMCLAHNNFLCELYSLKAIVKTDIKAVVTNDLAEPIVNPPYSLIILLAPSNAVIFNINKRMMLSICTLKEADTIDNDGLNT